MNDFHLPCYTMRAFFPLLLFTVILSSGLALIPYHTTKQWGRSASQMMPSLQMTTNDNEEDGNKTFQSTVAAFALGVMFSASAMFGGGNIAFAASDANYDGFAEYAKENQMEQSDVGCFFKKCGPQTKNLFSNPRGIKGITCLGRCKGEQSCATRCFAEFGSEDLNEWLSCTIEDNECVKVPKSIDNSAEDVAYPYAVKKFDPRSLVGVWYKTDGLNPNYDLFDCQTNTFQATNKDASELDMDIFLRVKRPEEAGGGFWENSLSEHMIVDAKLREIAAKEKAIEEEKALEAAKKAMEEAAAKEKAIEAEKALATSTSDDAGDKKEGTAEKAVVASTADGDGAKKESTAEKTIVAKSDDKKTTVAPKDDDDGKVERTMHTAGKMYGLQFEENWYILGESDGRGDIPEFKLVAYKGHTLQGNYEGSFVYAKSPQLPKAAIPAVRAAAAKGGLNWDDFSRIDNTCPPGKRLNDDEAGTGTSTSDWIDLVVGEGGVIDWISPGWRGEYKK